MIYKIIMFFFLLLPVSLIAQDDADKLIKEGVALYKTGDYQGSIAKFDDALKLIPDYEYAFYEKSLSLLRLRRFGEAADLLKKVVDGSKDKGLRLSAFANYGTVLDMDGKPRESLKVYEKGIKEFPNEHILYFNKGVTEAGLNELEEAIESFKKSVSLKPSHASSHHALARMTADKDRIKSILALFTFLLIEPEGKRAAENLILLESLVLKGVTRQDDKNVTINLDMGSLDKKKSKQDDFSSAELIFSLTVAHVPDSMKNMNNAEMLSYRIDKLISFIGDNEKNEKGFFRNFYMPFFNEMQKKAVIKTASYVVLTSSGKDDIYKWQNENKDHVETFLKWVDAYKWKEK